MRNGARIGHEGSKARHRTTENMEEIKAMLDELIYRHNFCTKNVLNVEEAAKFMDVSTKYIYKLTRTKVLPHYKNEFGKIFFKRVELEEWMTKYPVVSQKESQQRAAAVTVASV